MPQLSGQGQAVEGEEEAHEAPPPPPPREFRVRVHCIRAALNWLIENNPFYANVQIDESAMDMHAELEADVGMQDQADDPFHDVTVCELQHTTMMDADPHMPVDVVQAAAGGNANTDVGRHGGSSTLYFDLKRNTNAPYSMHRERGIEPRAFETCFPKGKNHWNSARPVSLPSLSMYFRQRIQNKDPRFQNPLYMGWACSTLQYSQLCSAADVAL